MFCFSIVLVIMDGHSSKGLLFWLTVFSKPCHYFQVHSQKNAWNSGNEIWKYLGYDLKCSCGNVCVPISRQNIYWYYSATIFWEISGKNKQPKSKKPHIPARQENIPDLRIGVLQQHSIINSTFEKETKVC